MAAFHHRARRCSCVVDSCGAGYTEGHTRRVWSWRVTEYVGGAQEGVGPSVLHSEGARGRLEHGKSEISPVFSPSMLERNCRLAPRFNSEMKMESRGGQLLS